MIKSLRKNSARAWLIVLFITLAIILGGGGTPNPSTELLLEIAFAVIAAAWLWLPGDTEGGRNPPIDPFALVLIAVVLLIPVVQLIPLPPSIWTHLPGRRNEVLALTLVGEQTSWRPISMSPSRTFASLLSIVPAAFCLYAVGRLEMHERRLVLVAIVVMAVVSSLVGAVQLTAQGTGLNFYPQHHIGWVTGFQANRNAEADVLLIGLLALAVVASPHLASTRNRLPLGLSRKTYAIFVGGVALLLLAATLMTGSRAGTALMVVALTGVALIFALSRRHARLAFSRRSSLLGIFVLLLGCIAVFILFAQDTAIERVVQRFTDTGDNRLPLWQDSWFALRQYWPVGFGMGGFEPAMIPAERLQYLDASVPNRAHNDYLEIGLEAGILGYLAVLAAASACLGWAWRSWRELPAMRTQIAFSIGVLTLIALHSVVDYPVRSMALACLTGVACGTLAKIEAIAAARRPVDRGEEAKDLT